MLLGLCTKCLHSRCMYFSKHECANVHTFCGKCGWDTLRHAATCSTSRISHRQDASTGTECKGKRTVAIQVDMSLMEWDCTDHPIESICYSESNTSDNTVNGVIETAHTFFEKIIGFKW